MTSGTGVEFKIDHHKDNDATPEALIVYATADRVFFVIFGFTK